MNPLETTQRLLELGWSMFHSDATLELDETYIKSIVGDWHQDGGVGITAKYKAGDPADEFLSAVCNEINEYLYGPDKSLDDDPILRVIIEGLRYAIHATRPTRATSDDKVLFEFELAYQNSGDVLLIIKSEIYESNADRIWLISKSLERVGALGLGGVH